MLPRHTVSTATHTLMTLSYISSVTGGTWRWPSNDRKCALHWMAANRLKLNTDKTEVLWAGSKYGSTPLGSGGPPLQLGDEIITPRDHVRLLCATISSDLSPGKHVSIASSTCFYWLRQLRRVRRSLNIEVWNLLKTCRKPGQKPGFKQDRSNGIRALTVFSHYSNFNTLYIYF